MPKIKLNLPDSASVAHSGSGGRLYAPSAARNYQAIRKVLLQYLPKTGSVLEIASGTGEHITRLGQAFPDLTWQPSDVEPDRLKSINAWQKVDGSMNVLTPIYLDATEPGWAEKNDGISAIILVNLLHLISAEEAEVLIAEAASSLVPGGVALFYGPFTRGGRFSSTGDAKFHEDLTGQDPNIGYKSFETIQKWQDEAGLLILEPIEMPASNLMLVASKPT